MDTTKLLETIRSRLAQDWDRRGFHCGAHRPAAVTIALFPAEEDVQVLFTRRTHTVASHKGEISFPGGGLDPDDETPLAGALREASEEVGLDPSEATFLGRMDEAVSTSGYLVTPFVIYVDRENYPFARQPAEVESIHMVPLSHLLDPVNHRYDTTTYPGRTIHRFDWHELHIWGLTGEMLYTFLKKVFDFPDTPALG